MNATSAVISDGALWATTPLFAAAHLWSWHPLWAAGIWTAYGISALFPQGEALLGQMTDSPLHYNLNPLHSRICGLKYGSVIFEVPANSSKNRMAGVLVTPVALSADSKHTAQPGEQDKSTSIITFNAARTNDQPALVPTSQWRASRDSKSHGVFSVPSNSDSFARRTHEIPPQMPFALPVLNKDRSSDRLSLALSSSPSSRTAQHLTGSGLGMYDRPTHAVFDVLSTPPSFGGQRVSKNDLFQRIGDYEIWGRPVRTWWRFSVVFLLALFVLGYVYKFLQCAYRMMVRLLLPPTAAPLDASVPNTTGPTASGSKAPAQITPATSAVVYNPATIQPVSASTNRKTVIRQYVQQWFQYPSHYWQALKNGLMARKAQFVLRAASLVWGNHQPQAQVLRATAILVFCMYIFMCAWIFFEDTLIGFLWAICNVMYQPATVPSGFGPTSIMNSSFTLHAPNGTTTAIFNCLWQIQQCTTSAFQTRLSPDGTYGPFPAPSSRTELVCERILRVVMSYKAVCLAISRTILGDLERCFDTARKNPMSSTGAYYPTRHFGRTASLCVAIERAVMGARSLMRSLAPFPVLLRSIWGFGHQILGCLPWYLRSSGALCPQWAGGIDNWTYHILTPMLLSAVVTLNFITIFYVKRYLFHAFLIGGSIALLWMYLRDTWAYQATQNWLFVTSTALLVIHARCLLVPWWIALLRWLRIAPRNSKTVHVQHAQERVAAGRSQLSS
jgi:hypothetical protein